MCKVTNIFSFQLQPAQNHKTKTHKCLEQWEDTIIASQYYSTGGR